MTQLCQAAQGRGLPIPVRMDGDRCTVRIDPALLALAGALSELSFEHPIELALGTSDLALGLRMTIDGQTAPARAADITPLGRELLTESWTFALWSHGTACAACDTHP